MTEPVNLTRGLKHVQVREHVRRLIADLPPGTAAPSERDLVARFGVARMTVRQAIDALVHEGLLQRSPGRGTFVARRLARPSRVPAGFTDEMHHRGLVPKSQTLLASRERASPGVARALGVEPGEPILHWRRLRRADQQVICIQNAFFAAGLLPGFPEAGIPESFYDALEEEGLRPTLAEDSITADLASPEEAQLLETRPGAPVLRVSRRASVSHQMLGVSRTVYRADRYTIYHQHLSH